MKQGLIALIALLVLSACNNGEPATTQADAQSQTDTAWVSLFDGSTTQGWHSYGKSTAGTAWKVADGLLYLDTMNKKDWQIADGGDLTSDGEYEHFHLSLEWKISPAGNSGIMFHVNEDTTKYKASFWTGPEMQILDKAHPDATVKHMAGDLYDLIEAKQRAEKPAGEWNLAEIVYNKGKLDFYLNGINTISTIKGDSSWNLMIAGSKFTEWPDFGTYSKGRIVLQDHGNYVAFKNIKIKNLQTDH